MNAKKATTAIIADAVQTITTGIKSIQVYASNDNGVRYRVTLDTAIDGIKKDTVTEEYVPTMIDYIDFVPSVLIAQCINNIEGLDLMYTKKKETGLKNDSSAGFGAAELQVVLRGAKLDIERTKFEAGSEYTTKSGEVLAHENSGYNTNIVKIKVSDRVQNKLDDMMDKVFDI